LWISRGDPQGTQLLENAEITLPYESVYSVAVNPNSGEFIYLGDASEHPLQRKASQTSVEAAQSIPFDPAKFAYHGENPSLGISYKMSWRPGATQVFLYTDVSRSGQERYTFLLDTNSGQPCELNLSGKTPAGQLAVNLFPHWSPNGRFLAVISVGGFSVLDTATGHVYEIDEKQLISTDIKGQLSINDIAWAPDNRHLAATVQVSDYSVPPGENYIKLRDLYVIDFVSNRAVQIPSDIKFGTTYGHTSILWSDDGSQLLVMCSAPGGLCLLPVQQNTQP
jgi:hypothetical protein